MPHSNRVSDYRPPATRRGPRRSRLTVPHLLACVALATGTTVACGALVEQTATSASAIITKDTSAPPKKPPAGARYDLTSSSRCPAYPAFPDETCTGPVGNLTPYEGSNRFFSGELIENVEIRMSEPLFIPATADGVIFRNVRFVYTGELDGTFAMINIQGTNVTFDNCEFNGQYKVGRAISSTVNGSSITVRNCNIHSTGNGIEASGPLVVEDNYIHEISVAPSTSWHADGIQTADGNTNDNIRIIHNTILAPTPSTSAIFVHGDGEDTAQDVLIQNNLLGGGSFTMYTFQGERYKIIDNAFTTRFWPTVGKYGIWYASANCCDYSGIVRSGNYILETGQAANT